MALTISINQAAAFTVNVGVPGPTGATGPAGPAGPVGPAGAGGIWGQITGTLSSQTDLATALAGKYSTTNPAGYIDLTTAGLYFYPLTGNPGDFATQAWVIGQNYLTVGSLAAYATMTWVNGELAGYALQSWVTSQGYITASALSPYLTSATAASTYQTISGMSGYAVTERGLPGGGSTNQVLVKSSSAAYDVSWSAIDLSAYATLSYVNSSFYGINNPDGFITASALTGYLLESTAASTYAVIAAGQPVSGTVGQVLTKNSGTNYDSSWTTIIPGDRYLTTSTTSLTINNANKTLTVGTGLSYTPTQNLTISYDASNHMHGEVLTYNSGTGVLTVDINNHTGTGTYASWVVNVGGVTPLASVAWGSITGTLGDQTDLSSSLAGCALLSGATFTGKVNTTVTATTAPINIGSQLAAPTTTVAGDLWIGTNINFKDKDGVQKVVANTTTTNHFTAIQTILVNSTGNALRINQQGTGPALVVEDSTSPDATPFVIDANGRVGIGVAPDATAALKVDAGGIKFNDGTTQTTAALPLAGGTMTGYLYSNIGNGMDSVMTEGNFKVKNTSTPTDYGELTAIALRIQNSVGGMVVGPDMITFPDATTQATAGYPASGNPSGFLTDAPSDGNYYSRYNGAWAVPSFGVPEAPNDGLLYARNNLNWTAFTAGIAAPAYSNAVWYGGGWYSANVTSLTDGYGNYYNALTL